MSAVRDALRYRFLRDHCGSSHPMTQGQPAEWSIEWGFQQQTPDDAAGAFDALIDRDIERLDADDREALGGAAVDRTVLAGRPTGSNADEWAVWLSERPADSIPYIAVQIAVAIEENVRNWQHLTSGAADYIEEAVDTFSAFIAYVEDYADRIEGADQAKENLLDMVTGGEAVHAQLSAAIRKEEPPMRKDDGPTDSNAEWDAWISGRPADMATEENVRIWKALAEERFRALELARAHIETLKAFREGVLTDQSGLLSAVADIIDYRGGASSPLEDEHVMERLHAAIAKAART